MTFLKKAAFLAKNRFYLGQRLFSSLKIERFTRLITCVVLQINDTTFLFFFHLIAKTC